MKNCPHPQCHMPNPEEAQFCGECGASFDSPREQTQSLPMEKEKAPLMGRVGTLLIVFGVLFFTVAFFAIPRFIRGGCNDGASKGNLGAIRSALSIYYGDMEGQYPSDLAALTIGGKYLSMIPLAKETGYHPDALHRLLEGVALPPAVTGDFHPDSSAIHFGRVPDDSGGWLYNNAPGDANIGSVMYNCTHTDMRGSAWSSY